MNLAELLVSIAVLGWLLAGLVTALDVGQRATALGAARVEAQQAARIALARLAHDVRHAGLGEGPPAFAAVSVVERARVVLHVDRDGDGHALATGETITWRLDGRVLRRDAGGGGQPVVPRVRDLAFTYLDAAGHPTAVPANVRTIGVRITVESAGGGGRTGGAVTMSTQARLRNR